jgi:RNA polymerase-associated protein RTF1
VEEGEVSDSNSEVFDDGYDDHFVGDEEDRRRLESMTEKEREEEIYHRSERREMLKTRFLIEKKIKKQQKKESGKVKEKKVKTPTKTKSSASNIDASYDEKVDSASDQDLDDSNSQGMDRRKVIENKKKETHVSKALANLKADREKKKKIGN